MAEFVALHDVAMAAVRMQDGASHGLPTVGTTSLQGSDRIVALGSDEWLALASDGDAVVLCGRMTAEGRVVVDVSGNRRRYRVEGSDALWFLAAGCSLDLEQLAPGNAVSTLIARAPAIIIAEDGGSFLVLIRRSFGSYIEAWAASVVG